MNILRKFIKYMYYKLGLDERKVWTIAIEEPYKRSFRIAVSPELLNRVKFDHMDRFIHRIIQQNLYGYKDCVDLKNKYYNALIIIAKSNPDEREFIVEVLNGKK